MFHGPISSSKLVRERRQVALQRADHARGDAREAIAKYSVWATDRRPPNRWTKPLNQIMVLGNSSLQLIRSAGWRANHIEETIRSIARLHAEHHQNATPLQRAVDRITALLGRPRFIGVPTVIAAGWISLNLLAGALGYRAIDPPPFSGLGGAVSLVSLYIVVLILATQRREYQLAQLREQLTLELA